MTDQQSLFCTHFLANGLNGTKAAKDAGYSEKSAYALANQLLRNLEVREYLNTELKKRKDDTELERGRWIRALESIAFAEVGEAIDLDTGTLRKNTEIPDEVKSAIEKIEVGEKGRKKITLSSKTKALELLGRHRGFLREDDKSGVTIIINASEADIV